MKSRHANQTERHGTHRSQWRDAKRRAEKRGAKQAEMKQAVREALLEMFDVDPERVIVIRATGCLSQKMLAEMVAQAGHYSKHVLLDLSAVRMIAGKKPMWRS